LIGYSLTCTAILLVTLLIRNIFTSHYNSNRISRKLNLEVDQNCGKEYICNSLGYEIYTIQLKNVYVFDFTSDIIALSLRCI